MGTIAGKLSYLNDTKGLFKDRLNSLGAEITSSTTFRNYLTWLDTFYNNVSDKTDLSVNGVVGRTSQETTTGKNLFNKLNYTQITTTGSSNPTNIVKQNDYISFTSSGSSNFSGLYIPNNSATNYIDNFNSSTNYYISFDVTVDKACKFGGGQTTTYVDIPIGKTRVSFYGTITGTINFYVRNAITDGVNVKIEKIMVSTSSDTTYEPYTYGASPNPNYPQPINNLSGDVLYKVSGKNMFDKNNSTFDEYLLETGETAGDQAWIITPYIKVDVGANYTYQGITRAGNAPYSCYYDSSKQFVSSFKQAEGTNTITIPSGVSYVRFSIMDRDANPDINTFMIEKGSTASTYEPYVSQIFTIPLGDIELGKITTYEDKIYSSNGRFYLNKNIGKVILDGSETWNIATNFWSPSIDGYAYSNNIPYSNYFKGVINQQAATSLTEDNTFAFKNRSGEPRLYLKSSSFTTTTEFKNWLSTYKPIVYYALATPITTEITSSNYPSLYNALKQIQDYLTAYKINKEFILGYSSPEIEY